MRLITTIVFVSGILVTDTFVLNRGVHGYLNKLNTKERRTRQILLSCSNEIAKECMCGNISTPATTPIRVAADDDCDDHLCELDASPPSPQSDPTPFERCSWYVIGESAQFALGELHRIRVWDDYYVVWRTNQHEVGPTKLPKAMCGDYSEAIAPTKLPEAMRGVVAPTKLVALQDACSHRGASLSCGHVTEDQSRVVCPYHGYEFNTNGTLVMVPGINMTQYYPCYSVPKFDIIEQHGWVYMNTIPSTKAAKVKAVNATEAVPSLFVEPEATQQDCVPVFLNMEYNCYSRILSENSLDLMHIPFTHSFGNVEHPAPVHERPPFAVHERPPFAVHEAITHNALRSSAKGDNPKEPYRGNPKEPNRGNPKESMHYKTTYTYLTGKNTIASKIFGSKTLVIENEFVLPHITIARVMFEGKVNTVMTSALPLGNDRCRLFVKVYRNFWTDGVSKYIGDTIMYDLMYKTMLQDKFIVENIDPRFMHGKYNMKYDKLQNLYRTLYRKWVRKDPPGVNK